MARAVATIQRRRMAAAARLGGRGWLCGLGAPLPSIYEREGSLGEGSLYSSPTPSPCWLVVEGKKDSFLSPLGHIVPV